MENHHLLNKDEVTVYNQRWHTDAGAPACLLSLLACKLSFQLWIFIQKPIFQTEFEFFQEWPHSWKNK